MEQIEKLKIKLGIDPDNTDKEPALNLCLEEAKEKLLLYLNVQELESRFDSILIDIAKTIYNRDNGETDVKSESHSEGAVSESITYKTRAEYESDIETMLFSLARYRKVYAKQKTETQD